MKKSKHTVAIVHSDGRREEITLADAILLYERRRDAATSDVERLHCQRRIEDLQSRWKKVLRGAARVTKTR